MELDKCLEVIQKSIDGFRDSNLESILQKLENHRIKIDDDFSNFTVEGIKDNSWGVYTFYINPKKPVIEFKDFNRLWETNSMNKKLVSPKAIKTRYRPLIKDKSYCLYLGKSENLIKRIEQHIHQKTKPSTYGLKLSEHDRLHLNNTFEFSYFVIKENPQKINEEALKYMLIALEKKLRVELSPLVGKQ